MIYRPTKAIINLKNIQQNTQTIIRKFPGYQYYMAVVKANCYGYRGTQVIESMIKGGANCLATSLLEEGVSLRNTFPNIPILLLNPVLKNQYDVCKEHQLAVTVATMKQALEVSSYEGLEIMIRVNGGSDILGGPTNVSEFEKIMNILNSSNNKIKGFYLHSYNALSKEDTENEYKLFETLTKDIDLSAYEMISIENSMSLPRYQKRLYSNCCRLGNIMYAIETEDSDLKSTFKLDTEVLGIITLKANQHIAYGHAYTAKTDGERIAAIPIGFGDGFSKSNIGRDVYINHKNYKIVAITMDITHILVDESINEGDKVELISNTHHLESISEHIKGATEEAICALNDRVPRVYINE